MSMIAHKFLKEKFELKQFDLVNNIYNFRIYDSCIFYFLKISKSRKHVKKIFFKIDIAQNVHTLKPYPTLLF